MRVLNPSLLPIIQSSKLLSFPISAFISFPFHINKTHHMRKGWAIYFLLCSIISPSPLLHHVLTKYPKRYSYMYFTHVKPSKRNIYTFDTIISSKFKPYKWKLFCSYTILKFFLSQEYVYLHLHLHFVPTFTYFLPLLLFSLLIMKLVKTYGSRLPPSVWQLHYKQRSHNILFSLQCLDSIKSTVFILF